MGYNGLLQALDVGYFEEDPVFLADLLSALEATEPSVARQSVDCFRSLVVDSDASSVTIDSGDETFSVDANAACCQSVCEGAERDDVDTPMIPLGDLISADKICCFRSVPPGFAVTITFIDQDPLACARTQWEENAYNYLKRATRFGAIASNPSSKLGVLVGVCEETDAERCAWESAHLSKAWPFAYWAFLQLTKRPKQEVRRIQDFAEQYVMQFRTLPVEGRRLMVEWIEHVSMLINFSNRVAPQDRAKLITGCADYLRLMAGVAIRRGQLLLKEVVEIFIILGRPMQDAWRFYAEDDEFDSYASASLSAVAESTIHGSLKRKA